jgi:glycosyltransferase involved in cell wall biosynthesis
MARTETNQGVFVVNSANPEVDRLAGELAGRGKLQTLVRRYANMGRPWERALAWFPPVSRQYANTMGKRTLPPGLERNQVMDAGVAFDFAAAAAIRVRSGPARLAANKWLLERRRRSIARKAASQAAKASAVVGNYGVSLRAFESIKRSGGCTILNYPNAHHRFQSELLAEEALREPRFAGTFTTETLSLAGVFDQECALADLILVGSSFARRTFQVAGLKTDNVAVVSYGCDTSMFAPDDAQRPDNIFRAVFVGQLSQRKGLSYLLRGYAAFRGAGTELVLAGRHVGDPEILSPYRWLYTYMGSIPQRRVAALFQQADVFVFPTLMEGMGLSLLQAMSSGLPVITTDRGTAELVRDGVEGFIVPIRDPGAIAERLELLRSCPELRIAMGRAARARALEFTWARYCRQAADTVLQFIGDEKLERDSGWRAQASQGAIASSHSKPDVGSKTDERQISE